MKGVVTDIDVRDIVDYADGMKRVGDRGVKQALGRALRDTGRRSLTKVRRATAKSMGMKYSDVLPRVKEDWKPKELYYDIVGRGAYTRLVEYGPNQRKKGVSARPWGKRRIFRGTFLAKNIFGAPEVFKRTGEFVVATRGPNKGKRVEKIEPLFGPAIPKEMINKQVTGEFFASVAEHLTNRFEHEIMAIEKGYVKIRGGRKSG